MMEWSQSDVNLRPKPGISGDFEGTSRGDFEGRDFEGQPSNYKLGGPPGGTTNQEEKRRFRERGRGSLPAARQFWNGPGALLRAEDLREALRARKTREEPGSAPA